MKASFLVIQVAFGIDLNSINDTDSPFLAAIKEVIKAPIWIISNPFHALDITSYAYQNMVISAVQFLRDFGKKVIDERRRSVRDGDDLPPDILSHILKTAEQDPSISMEDLLDDFLTFFIAGEVCESVVKKLNGHIPLFVCSLIYFMFVMLVLHIK